MEHPDLAQFAAVVAAAGAVLLLAGRGRVRCWRAWACWAPARRPAGPRDLGHRQARHRDLRRRRRGGAGGRRGARRRRGGGGAPARMGARGGAGGGPASPADRIRVRRRLPDRHRRGRPARAAAPALLRAGGRRAGAGLACGHSDSGRGARPAAGGGLPAAAFIAFACLSLTWADRLAPAAELLTYFTMPFALLLAVVARSPFPDWAPRALARVGVALGVVFAAIGLYQAATRELFFFAPNLAVSNDNSDFFRVTSLFGDPSLYGRHVVLAIGVLLVVLALRRVDLRLGHRPAGGDVGRAVLLLLAVEHGRADRGDAGGGRGHRRAAGADAWWPAGLAAGAAGRGGLRGLDRDPGDSLRRETSDRTQRVEDTVRVVQREPARRAWASAARPPASRRLLAGRTRGPTDGELRVAHHPADGGGRARRDRAGALLWLLVGGARAIAGGGAARSRAGAGARRVPARAVRARAVLQRLPRGSAHLVRAGRGRRASSPGRGATTACTATATAAEA